MSFQIATVNDTQSPSRATNFRALRLGGPNGLIAKFVGESGAAAEAPWALAGHRLLELAGETTWDSLVFFLPGEDASPDGSKEIYQLKTLNGVATTDRTDVVCFFSPLRMYEAVPGTWELTPSGGRHLCESLSLTGGTAGGRWLWTEAAMTLGATVVGLASGCTGGCSSAPPTRSCCGSGCHET